MKKLLVLLFGVTLSALLVGCASSPSIEEQAKLIEYQNCLEALRQGHPGFDTVDRAMKAQDFQITTCSIYRP